MSDERRLVLVEWVDSYGCSSTWEDMVDVRPGLMLCRSVGWVVAENEDALTVVPHIATGEALAPEGQGCGDMTIPRVAVKSVTDLVLAGLNVAMREPIPNYHARPPTPPRRKKARTSAGRGESGDS